LHRILSIVLLICYPASQLAVVPHAHGSSGEFNPLEHNARPHFHVPWFACNDHGGHHHSHCDHSLDTSHTHPHTDKGSHAQPASSDENPGHGDHDSDAVYLPTDTGPAMFTKCVDSPDSLQIFSALTNALAVAPPPCISRQADDGYPDACCLGCPLYLALRALRI
jgi:hypothetical protein